MLTSEELTKEEWKAIRALKKVAESWPKSLWLFSASGSLCVMKTGADGERVYTNGYVDQDYIVGEVSIPNDGGDF